MNTKTKLVNLPEKNQTTIAKIKKYFQKHNYNLIFSIYLEDYNHTNFFIAFILDKKLMAYKTIWFDLNFINLHKLPSYQNSQIVNKKIAFNIVDSLKKIKMAEEIRENNDIIGDRVYLTLTTGPNDLTYGFTRFLPQDWENFIDPIVLVFSHLPRSMDIFLQEFFAIFDGTEEIFTYTKPIKFNLLKTKPTNLFKNIHIDLGTKFYADSRVTFLEKIEGKYFSIVEDNQSHLVILNQVDDDHAMMWCNCKKGYLCSHIYASLLALRHKSFTNFYKVKYIGDNIPLLDQLMSGNIYLCYGINNDKILLLDIYGNLMKPTITKNRKCLFEVIEDDDDYSLSKILKEYQK